MTKHNFKRKNFAKSRGGSRKAKQFIPMEKFINRSPIALNEKPAFDEAARFTDFELKKEMSKVDAHFEIIPEIVKLRDEIAPQTLLQINGDILSVEQGLALAEKYPAVDGIMIGRGVFHNPFVFEKEAKSHSKDELLGLLKLHLDIFDEYATRFEIRKFEPLKRFFKIYVREFDGASDLRTKLMETKSTDEVRAVLADFEKNAPQK